MTREEDSMKDHKVLNPVARDLEPRRDARGGACYVRFDVDPPDPPKDTKTSSNWTVLN